MQDPLTLVFIVLAGIVLFRLYKVLGEREGHEDQPYNPFERRSENQNTSPHVVVDNDANDDNLIAIEERAQDLKAKKEDPFLGTLYEHDPDFDKKDFLQGASNAYETILVSFAEADLSTLRDLISRDLMPTFKDAIEARQMDGHTMTTTFIGVDKADIIKAEADEKTERVTVNFVSQMISVTKDADGNTVEGDDADIQTIDDTWVFERAINARDPNWLLTSTEG